MLLNYYLFIFLKNETNLKVTYYEAEVFSIYLEGLSEETFNILDPQSEMELLLLLLLSSSSSFHMDLKGSQDRLVTRKDCLFDLDTLVARCVCVCVCVCVGGGRRELH